MARVSAPLVALACAGLISGLLVSSVAAQDADEAPAPPKARVRTRAPIQRVRGEANDNEIPQNEDRDAPYEGETRKPPRLPRGEIQPLRIPPITAEMLKVLQDWERETAQITELYGSVNRITYDWTFNTQKECKGRFAYKAPDNGVFRMSNVPYPATAPGFKKKNAQGQEVQFVRAESKPEHWICNGKELFNIDHTLKTYEVLVIPPENRGKAIMETPLPFLFGMKVQQARARYAMKFLKDPSKTPGMIWLTVRPLWQRDSANYREARLILDAKTFLPNAVQLFDPPGTTETVYQFEDLEKKLPFFKRDPFKELPPSSYKRAQTAQGKADSKGPVR